MSIFSCACSGGVTFPTDAVLREVWTPVLSTKNRFRSERVDALVGYSERNAPCDRPTAQRVLDRRP